jgi:signal transduction histidine kinase
MATMPRAGAFRAMLSQRWASAAVMGVFTLVVVGAFIGFMALDLVQMRATAIRNSERNTASFALVLAENLGQTASAVDQVLQAFVPKLNGDKDRSFAAMDRLRGQLMESISSIPEAQIFAAFNAKGMRFLNLTDWPESHSSSGAQKDYFIAHRDNPGLGLFISKVFRSGSGYTVISLTRRLENPDGSFAGTLAISIAPKYLQRVYDQAGFNRNGSISLYRADGTLLVRHPESARQINRSFEDSSLFSAGLREAPVGTMETASPIDGVRRITSYRRVDGAPLVIAVSESFDEVLREWHALVTRYLALALLIAIAVGGFAFAVYRQMMKRASSDRRFRAAMDSTANAFFTLSPHASADGTLDFTIKDANKAAAVLVGSDRTGLIGASLAVVGHGFPVRPVLAICTQTHRAGEAQNVSLKSILDGEECWFRVRATPFPDGVALSMADVTDEYTARAALEVAKEGAERANRTKSDFLANMSHELRTPLNAVIGFADMIAQQLFGPVGSDRYREYAELIRMSGVHLLDVISDILDLAKVEANRIVLDDDEVDVPAVLRTCATLVATRAEQAGVIVRVEAPADIPSVIADELRLKQIVLNLASNAVKFSSKGGEVRLSVRLGENGGLAIAVSDRGCGMTDQEVALALEPFGQVNSAVAKSKEGTGLGLPLARRLTEIHGGTLLIDSKPGKGTIVTVSIPPHRVLGLALAQAV